MKRTASHGCWLVNLFSTLNPFGYVAVLLLALSAPVFASAAPKSSFDVPLKKKVVDFGLSEGSHPGRRSFRVRLHCFFYPTFVIKDYIDDGLKGSVWLSIVPVQKGAIPACTRSHVLGERLIEPPELSGYFMGAKGNLVFFEGADGGGVLGGIYFVVYDSTTGKEILEDAAYDSKVGNQKVEYSPFNQLRVSSAKDGQTSLTYLREEEAGCDLHGDGASCWEKVRKKLELISPQRPVCTDYEEISGFNESVVAHPVEVLLFPQPTVTTIAGPIKCWPIE